MMTEIYFPAIYSGAGAGNGDLTGHESSEIGGRGRPEPDIPTGLNLGMPWQWEGDVRAKRAMLGLPGWYDWHWASGGENYQIIDPLLIFHVCPPPKVC